MTDETLDLGGGYTLHWIGWHPDRDLNPQYDGIADIEKCVGIIRHPLHPDDDQQYCRERGYCEGAVHPDTPEVRQIMNPKALWQVGSWDPLTLSPSVLCHCGDHGWIRDGKWVKA